MAYATSPATENYQPMHVNFGLMPPLENPVKQKRERYGQFARRGAAALRAYGGALVEAGLLSPRQREAGAEAAEPFLPEEG